MAKKNPETTAAPAPRNFDHDMRIVAELLTQAMARLEPHLQRLTDEQRKQTTRPREGIEPAMRDFATKLESHPVIAKAAHFDPAAAIDLLDKTATLSGIAEQVNDIAQGVADTKLVFVAQAQKPTLHAYGIAKIAAQSDASLQPAVDALATVFVSKKPRKQPTPPTDK